MKTPIDNDTRVGLGNLHRDLPRRFHDGRRQRDFHTEIRENSTRNEKREVAMNPPLVVEMLVQDGEVQTLTVEPSPTILSQLGLPAAVEWLGERLGEMFEFEFRRTGDERLPELPETISGLAFQSIRELLTNVCKHARAKQVETSVTFQAGRLTVRVRDDGQGFDPDRKPAANGRAASFGLFSIQERMRHLGGTVELVSKPGRGTEVVLSVPVTVPAE